MNIQDELLNRAKEMAGLKSDSLLGKAGSLLGGKSNSEGGDSDGGLGTRPTLDSTACIVRAANAVTRH